VPHCGPLSPERVGGRPLLEVADIFRAHGQAYRECHALSPEQREVMRAIETCRTAVLGGHEEVCDQCGFVLLSYNSCRNRHCPKCQSLDQARWIAERIERILPTHYFHVVFTLPEELRPLGDRNSSALFDLLFRSASQTLLELGRDPEWLGGMLGVTALLHTWTRELLFHPHLHCIVTGGALSPDGTEWRSTKPDFLFPVFVLSPLFRGKFLCGLRTLYDRGKLDLDGRCVGLRDPVAFSQLVDRLFRKDWVVYAKRPFGGPEQTVKYLGRYTHRVGISNARLVAFEDGQVTFSTKDGRKVTVSAETFIGRFLLHVLPPGFVKIRHYGLMSACHSKTTLERARELLQAEATPEGTGAMLEADPYKELSWQELYRLLTGSDLTICPRCGQGRLVPRPLSAESVRRSPGVREDSS
jgi:hypothetical protein